MYVLICSTERKLNLSWHTLYTITLSTIENYEVWIVSPSDRWCQFRRMCWGSNL